MRKIVALTIALLIGMWLSAQTVNVTYHKNGNVKTTVYESGDHIERVTYFKNGRIKEVASFLNDKPHGKWQVYDKKERLISEGDYMNGKKTGVWLIYNVTNKKVYQVTYRNDVKIDSREWARTKDE
jgi:antitoxin component YwqK of YwqJK toxin-antitoxin module